MTGYKSKKAAAQGKLAQESVVERAWFTIDELNAWVDKKLAENPHWVMPPRMETPRPGASDHLNIKRRGV